MNEKVKSFLRDPLLWLTLIVAFGAVILASGEGANGRAWTGLAVGVGWTLAISLLARQTPPDTVRRFPLPALAAVLALPVVIWSIVDLTSDAIIPTAIVMVTNLAMIVIFVFQCIRFAMGRSEVEM